MISMLDIMIRNLLRRMIVLTYKVDVGGKLMDDEGREAGWIGYAVVVAAIYLAGTRCCNLRKSSSLLYQSVAVETDIETSIVDVVERSWIDIAKIARHKSHHANEQKCHHSFGDFLILSVIVGGRR
eukprot:scaffold1002_cov108-Alexandrium_tamarense.AAC.1